FVTGLGRIGHRSVAQPLEPWGQDRCAAGERGRISRQPKGTLAGGENCFRPKGIESPPPVTTSCPELPESAVPSPVLSWQGSPTIPAKGPHRSQRSSEVKERVGQRSPNIGRILLGRRIVAGLAIRHRRYPRFAARSA